MTRLIIPALVALLVSGLAGSSYAKEGERLPNFKQLCIADASTGFNWQNGGWKHTRFKPKKFVVSKILPPRSIEGAHKIRSADRKLDMAKAFLHCGEDMTRNENKVGVFRSYNACLKIQNVGNKFWDYVGCFEFHSKSKEMKNWRVNFSCDGFEFTPNGHFHRAIIHDHLEAKPKNDYKDSLSISVGRCADISN